MDKDTFEADLYRRTYVVTMAFATLLVLAVVTQTEVLLQLEVPPRFSGPFFVLEMPVIAWVLWRLMFRRYAEYVFGSRLTFADNLVNIEARGTTMQLAATDITAIECAQGWCVVVTKFHRIGFHLWSHRRRAELLERFEAFRQAGRAAPGADLASRDLNDAWVFESERMPGSMLITLFMPSAALFVLMERVFSASTTAVAMLVAVALMRAFYPAYHRKHFGSRVTLAGETLTVEVFDPCTTAKLAVADITAIERDEQWCTIVTKNERVRFHLLSYRHQDELVARLEALRTRPRPV